MYVYLGSLVNVGTGNRQRTTGEGVLYGVDLLATVTVTIFVTRLARGALAEESQGSHDALVHLCIKAFSETDQAEDLKRIDVPTLMLHGDDDQIVPMADSALLSAKLVKNATLKVYEGGSHGMWERCHELERRSVAGWYSGTARDSQDGLEFSALNGVHSMIEKYPLSHVAEAFEQMHSGKARFRVVLTMN
jgi:non-heme chloroperoxidase